MRLLYHKGKNFGDELNPYLFNHLLPSFFDDDSSEVFLGIGSILGLKKPANDKQIVHVFSSGCGGQFSGTYGDVPTDLSQYRIHCVRGPKTASLLGIQPELAIADAAILTPLVFPKEQLKKSPTHHISFIPHIGSLSFNENLSQTLNKAGIHCIDPRAGVEQVISEIVNSKLIITEAMHGAILADSYRIPWIPVKCYQTINEFKWNDYCLSMGLKYSPVILPGIFSKPYLKLVLKQKRITVFNGLIASLLSVFFENYRKTLFIRSLKKIIDKVTPQLSDPALLKDKQEQLLAILKKLATE